MGFWFGFVLLFFVVCLVFFFGGGDREVLLLFVLVVFFLIQVNKIHIKLFLASSRDSVKGNPFCSSGSSFFPDVFAESFLLLGTEICCFLPML